jgi:hypothetical protein
MDLLVFIILVYLTVRYPGEIGEEPETPENQ